MAEPAVRVVSDVHAGFEALRAVAAADGPLLILGDFLNFIDYRTGEGMVADILGLEFARRAAQARGTGADARPMWMEAISAHAGDFGADLIAAAKDQYRQAAEVLGDAEVYATFGNVDHPELLESILGDQITVLHGSSVEIGGLRYGFAGGGRRSPFGFIPSPTIEDALDELGPVDVLCTHVPPDVPTLYRDVVTGLDEKRSPAINEYLATHHPRLHLFGDVHQPRASRWRVGETLCVNVGYFRATGRAVAVTAGGQVC